MELELLKEQAWLILKPQLRFLVVELQKIVKANPGISKANAAAAIEALEWPYPGAIVQVALKLDFLNWFVGKLGTWARAKQVLINHPLKVILAFDNRERPVPATDLDMKIIRVVHTQEDSNWPGDMDWPTDRVKQEILIDDPGGLFHNRLEKNRWSATLDGALVVLEQSITWELADGRATPTYGPIEEV